MRDNDCLLTFFFNLEVGLCKNKRQLTGYIINTFGVVHT